MHSVLCTRDITHGFKVGKVADTNAERLRFQIRKGRVHEKKNRVNERQADDAKPFSCRLVAIGSKSLSRTFSPPLGIASAPSAAASAGLAAASPCSSVPALYLKRTKERAKVQNAIIVVVGDGGGRSGKSERRRGREA